MYSQQAGRVPGRIVSQASGGLTAMLDHRIAELASRQYGLFSRSQVLACGGTDDLIKQRLGAGRWKQVAPGVYLLPGWPESWHRSLWLAHLDIGPASVVSHEAAAALHGLLLFPPGPVVLTVAHGDHERPSRLWRVHQSTDLRPEHVTESGGLSVTTVARTFFDLSAVAHKERLGRSLDDAHAGGVCRVEKVRALYEELRRPRKPGMKRLGELLALRGPGYVPPESVLERRLLKALTGEGLPAPVRQYALPWREKARERVDLAYPEQKVIVEGDGRRWHSRMDQMAADRRRDREALNRGWRPYRFVWEEISRQPEMVRLTLIEALDLAA